MATTLLPAWCQDFEGHGNGTRGCFSVGNIEVISDKDTPKERTQSLPLQAARPATQTPQKTGEQHL